MKKKYDDKERERGRENNPRGNGGSSSSTPRWIITFFSCETRQKYKFLLETPETNSNEKKKKKNSP